MTFTSTAPSASMRVIALKSDDAWADVVDLCTMMRFAMQGAGLV